MLHSQAFVPHPLPQECLVAMGITDSSLTIKDKDARDVSKFLNRLLGLGVERQNLVNTELELRLWTDCLWHEIEIRALGKTAVTSSWRWGPRNAAWETFCGSAGWGREEGGAQNLRYITANCELVPCSSEMLCFSVHVKALWLSYVSLAFIRRWLQMNTRMMARGRDSCTLCYCWISSGNGASEWGNISPRILMAYGCHPGMKNDWEVQLLGLLDIRWTGDWPERISYHIILSFADVHLFYWMSSRRNWGRQERREVGHCIYALHHENVSRLWKFSQLNASLYLPFLHLSLAPKALPQCSGIPGIIFASASVLMPASDWVTVSVLW